MAIIGKLKLARRWVKKVFLLKEKSGVKVRIPFHTKLKYNLLGFTDFQYVIYDLKNNDHHNYISMWERYKLEYVNGDFAVALSQKLLFYRMFQDYINLPRIYGWVKNHNLIDVMDGSKSVDLIRILEDEKEVIAKPNHSIGGGKGIFKLRYAGGKYYFGDEIVDKEEMLKRVDDCEEYLFSQVAKSHEYSKKIFPYSVNTMRIVTVMDENHRNAEVLFAFHRFGTNESAPVDNMSKGGLFAYIDEKGICSAAKQLYHIDREYIYHPDSGVQIKGLQIPQWAFLIDYVKKAHQSFPFYDFFAWDIMLGEDGIPYVMEINRGSDLSIQMIHPMRKDKLGEYMKRKGLLDKR